MIHKISNVVIVSSQKSDLTESLGVGKEEGKRLQCLTQAQNKPGLFHGIDSLDFYI